MDKQVFIVFFSANGSTRLAAEAIEEGFAKRGTTVSMLALGRSGDIDGFADKLHAAGSQACLFIGSPVYRDGAAPAVMAFIEALPSVDSAAAVPFVTWGKACSGVALWQLGAALTAKGFGLAGAAKVEAVHSLMWRVNDRPGGGHPDEDDRRQLQDMVDTLWDRFESAGPQSIALERLDYQPPGPAAQMKEKITAPWTITPKTVDQSACTQCGVCEENCPVAAIGLDPYPEFDDSCCNCFNCIRLCPEAAIEPAMGMDKIQSGIYARVQKIGERPGTQIFL